MLDQVLEGTILKVPAQGEPVIVESIPEGYQPIYSGRHVVFGEPQENQPVNEIAQNWTNCRIIGDVVFVSQKKAHEFHAEIEAKAKAEAEEKSADDGIATA